MEWIDLRNPIAERAVGIAAERGEGIFTYECKIINGRLRLFLLRQDLAGGKETMVFSAAAAKGDAPGGIASGRGDWLIAAVWDGSLEMEVFGLSAENGAEQWHKHVEWPGKMDWFFPLSANSFLVRFQIPEQEPLFARYQKAAGAGNVVFLYGPGGVCLVKDPILAKVRPEQAFLQDGMVVLQQCGMTEEEKEHRYLEERSKWIGLPEAKDCILAADVESLLQGVWAGAECLPFQTAVRVGIDRFARFTALAEGQIYYRSKFFPSKKEKLCAWELGSGQVREICPWGPGYLQQGGCVYHAEAEDGGIRVKGVWGSQMDVVYPTKFGTLRRVLKDRYLVLSNRAPGEREELVTLMDPQTGEAQTWESAWETAAGTLILW